MVPRGEHQFGRTNVSPGDPVPDRPAEPSPHLRCIEWLQPDVHVDRDGVDDLDGDAVVPVGPRLGVMDQRP